MKQICDLHLHSRYSGGTSNSINIPTLAKNSHIKGIDIVGTGDCLHYKWIKDLRNDLIEYSEGLYVYPKLPNVKFLLQTEVELIWSLKNRIKKVHFLLLFPNFEVLNKVITNFSKFCDLKQDGRPKLHISGEDFIFKLKEIDSLIEIVPAHVFTPYFGILGSNNQFSSLKEAVGKGITYINAIESGLSADPEMINRITELRDLTVLSFSDAHSTNFHRIGREVTSLKLHKLNYKSILSAIQNKKIFKTYEFKPAAGKYYYDGHRAERHPQYDEFFCSPRRKIVRCPICNQQLTFGVLNRCNKLSRNKNKGSYQKCQYIIPLLTLIKEVLGGNEYSKRNISLYIDLVRKNQGEFNIWESHDKTEGAPTLLINAINKIRGGKFYFIPGYDGVYGKLRFQ